MNAKDVYFYTPLHWAADTGIDGKGYIEVARLLILNGANVDAKDKNGVTALLRAVGGSHRDVCEFLISKGADVNAKDQYGHTALMIVAFYTHEREICKLLIEKGADINATMRDGSTALDLAVVLGDRQMAELLRPKTSNTTQTASSEEAFFKAIGAGDKTTIEKMLSSNSALLRSRTKGPPAGLTPLHLAALRGKTAILELLIQKGADVNAKVEGTEFKNWTALHFLAFYFRSRQCIKLTY